MAYVLALYRQLEGIDELALARKLGTMPELVLRLALAKRPDSDSSDFDSLIQQLSDSALVDPVALKAIICEVERSAKRGSVAKVREDAGVETGALTIGANLASPIGYRWHLSRAKWVWAMAGVASLLLGILGATALWNNWNEAPSTGTATESRRPPSASPAHSNADHSSAHRPPTSEGASDLSKAGPPKHSTDLIAKATIEIDLRNDPGFAGTGLRDSTPGAEKIENLIKLPHSPARLAITLPEGSPKGLYRVEIRDPFGTTKDSRRGRNSSSGKLVVEIDLGHLSKGQYYLCISHSGEVPECLPVEVRGK